MAIQKFSVSAEIAKDFGLPAVEMSRLGKFVAIAGKNGSGKTRLLDLLCEMAEVTKLNAPNFDQMASNRESWRAAMPHQIGNQAQAYADAIRNVDVVEARIGTLEWTGPAEVLKFVPKVLSLTDPLALTRGVNQASVQSAAAATHETWNTLVLPYIQEVQNRRWEATHPDTAIGGVQAIGDYDRLRSLLKSLLGVDVGRDDAGNATLFTRNLGDSKLSDGQKVLIQLAVALHARGESLAQAVLVMDEPENHLHPAALVEVLHAIHRNAPHAQIWLATHSVPLLAYVSSLEPMSIWYMEDGVVSNAGRHPENVLRALLGHDEGAEQIVSFASLPAVLAANNFAAECLKPPGVIGHQEGDRQIEQIRSVIGLGAKEVLDFGAGKGRLAASLVDVPDVDRWSYVAFDQDDKDAATCKTAIAQLYPEDDSTRYFNDASKLRTSRGEGWADVVVMTNVLHEIEPAKWLELFAPSGLIRRSLKDDGHLLIVEDQRIPVGELAHKFGFLVLDSAELMDLFSIKPEEQHPRGREFISADQDGRGRLKAHLISKSLLARATGDTRKKSIASLQDRAAAEIERVRGLDPTHANGLLHALWTQQLANAFLFLRTQ